ncbi:putative alpha-amylase [Escherichia coli]|uniref:Putative alpha-amylase n=1 Tax=Escherichia coli TaxID=562 RepID=A0A377AJC4_ECOLX|nr:putative alpha-amylase [Escherichia coli]
MSEFARCHYGYIQIPPVTTFRADGPETPEEEKVTGFTLINPKIFVPSITQWEICRILSHWLKMLKNLVCDIIPDYTFNFMGIGVVVKMTWIIPLLIYERRSVKI